MQYFLVNSKKSFLAGWFFLALFFANAAVAQDRGVFPPMADRVSICDGQFLVKFDFAIGNDEVIKLTGLLSAAFIEPIGESGIYLFKLKPDVDVEKFTNTLEDALRKIYPQKKRPTVEVGLDHVLRAGGDGDISGSISQLFSDKLWGLKQIQADKLDGKFNSLGDPNIIIAILDSGVDNPDLKASLWRHEKPLKLSLKGMNDIECGPDTYGVNFMATRREDVCLPLDDYGHGTQVAGIISANGEARGVSPNVQILPIKAIDGDSRGCSSDVIRAWELIARINREMYFGQAKKIRIVNHSYGFDAGHITPREIAWVQEAIRKTDYENLLLVASAGNSGNCAAAVPNISSHMHYPASISSPNLISVAASGRDDKILCSSNRGPATIEVAAPGIEIFTTQRGGGHGDFDKTSAAAPFVSAAAALVLSNCPWLNNKEVKK
jgi:subtilisin family serine protease